MLISVKSRLLYARHSQSNVRKSNSIHGLSSIEFGNRTKLGTELCVSSISEPIELNRFYKYQEFINQNVRFSSIVQLFLCEFDLVRLPNSIHEFGLIYGPTELQFDWV